jgi:hypothetical protein
MFLVKLLSSECLIKPFNVCKNMQKLVRVKLSFMRNSCVCVCVRVRVCVRVLCM